MSFNNQSKKEATSTKVASGMEAFKELNKTIKTLKDSNDSLRKEIKKLKLDSTELARLKKENITLSNRIMDLESEAILYQNQEKGDINLLLPSNSVSNLQTNLPSIQKFTISKNNFCIIQTNNQSKQSIKESLKNKNEEILILKNELVKKEKDIFNLEEQLAKKTLILKSYKNYNYNFNYEGGVMINDNDNSLNGNIKYFNGLNCNCNGSTLIKNKSDQCLINHSKIYDNLLFIINKNKNNNCKNDNVINCSTEKNVQNTTQNNQNIQSIPVSKKNKNMRNRKSYTNNSCKNKIELASAKSNKKNKPIKFSICKDSKDKPKNTGGALSISNNGSNANQNTVNAINKQQEATPLKNKNDTNVNYNSIVKENYNDKNSNLNLTNLSKLNDWGNHYPGLNSIHNIDEDDFLQKNIFSEINNILEEKRNFILQTLTSENFSFEILSKCKINNLNNYKGQNNCSCNSENKDNVQKGIFISNTTNNFNNKNTINYQCPALIGSNLSKNIEAILMIIKERKKIVENERKNIEGMMDHLG